MSESIPLLPRAAESHPIFLRAAHSPWSGLDQGILTGIRLVLAGYLTAVLGVALKWKLETEEVHGKSRIIFQFSTVSFFLLWAWHLLLTLWTAMHFFFPYEIAIDPEGSRQHRFKARLITILSPPSNASNENARFLFNLFYITTHVFAFMNTLVYWGAEVPAGHGGFRPPSFPKHHHSGPGHNATATYDPHKGLFEEDNIKPFSIINLSIINSLIAGIEIFFLNSIRRPTLVVSQTAGVMYASFLYLVWAWFGGLVTGHFGIFFLDPDDMGGQMEAVVAACIAFVSLTPGLFAYVYGLIAMREQMTAAPRGS